MPPTLEGIVMIKFKTHCGLVMPNRDIDLSQNWQHQAIACTNVEFSLVKSFGSHMRVISHKMLKVSLFYISFKITNLRLQPHLPGANELRWYLSFEIALVPEIYPQLINPSMKYIAKIVLKILFLE